MTEQDRIQIAERFIAAFNDGDWQKFRMPLASDVRYMESGSQRRTTDVNAYMQLCQGWKQAFPDAQGTIQQAVASGDTVVQELTWQGTHRGDMATPNGVLAASGKPITVTASIWYTFQGDTIQELHHHLDLLALLSQIGALPAPA